MSAPNALSSSHVYFSIISLNAPMCELWDIFISFKSEHKSSFLAVVLCGVFSELTSEQHSSFLVVLCIISCYIRPISGFYYNGKHVNACCFSQITCRE